MIQKEVKNVVLKLSISFFSFSINFCWLKCEGIIWVGTGSSLFVVIAHEVQVHHVIESGVEVVAKYVGVIASAERTLKNRFVLLIK